ncbi:hypothetical protein [Lacrimispora sp.]|uniref:hypothetical protein n=1 Tax=Lacrimispora sp. TaxID=2719234 RepID=UPI0029E0E431|nr:hypothetical protein [Lacrimispora sp.]
MDNSTIIAEYFKQHFLIEQIKYNMYYEDDIYSKIPTLSFRFVDDSYIDELKNYIESFQGRLKWTIFKSFYGKRRPNYLLCPIEIYWMNKEIYKSGDIQSQKEYFSEEEFKRLCQYGVMDIPDLYKFIKNKYGD